MRDTGNMIEVSRLDGKRYWINPHQIESITVNPDVTLRMLSGKAVVVKDTPDEVIRKIIDYRRQIGAFANES
jgi:flagellar protein FlbD